jgi:hypothetical protein
VLVVPTVVLAKVSEAGESVTDPDELPVPLKLTVCVLEIALELSATVNVAVNVPEVVLVNDTGIVQLDPAARAVVVLQVVVSVKSLLLVPEMPMEVMVKGAVPVFDNVAV